MSVLITGGGGFIGAYVLRNLLACTEHRAVIFDRNIDEIRERAKIFRSEQGRIHWECGDIVDNNFLEDVFSKYKIHQVIHLAVVLLRASEKDPSHAIRVNCEGTHNVFSAALKADVRKVVWPSSIAVFGAPNEYKTDILPVDAPFNPHTIYGACKAFDEYLAKYYLYKGLNLVGLRFCLVYGPGRGTGKGSGADFITELIDKSISGEEWVSIPYGEESFNFLYIEDAVRSIMLALSDSGKTGVYTICGEYRSLKDMASHVKKLAPQAKIRLQPGTYSLCWLHDMKPALEGIGYFPEFTMEKGIEKYIEILRKDKNVSDL